MNSTNTALDRMAVCQALLDARGGGHYLEIGIDTGCCFIPIRARAKWGVDPAYQLTWRRRLKYAVFSALRLKEERLFRLPSDVFFARHGGWLARRGIDVAFVDGLHTYEQSLRDVENVLRFLRPGGIIVMHDCNPADERAATPAASMAAMVGLQSDANWAGAWNGDVWKTVVHLRALRPDLDVRVLDCDEGLGLVCRSPNRAGLALERDAIAGMTYADLAADRTHLLGLMPAERWPEWLGRLAAAGGTHD